MTAAFVFFFFSFSQPKFIWLVQGTETASLTSSTDVTATQQAPQHTDAYSLLNNRHFPLSIVSHNQSSVFAFTVLKNTKCLENALRGPNFHLKINDIEWVKGNFYKIEAKHEILLDYHFLFLENLITEGGS